MDINKLIKEAHENAIDKGFYDCEICKGKGFVDLNEDGIEDCWHCDSTGLDQNKPIVLLLTLINSELYEALQAHRKSNFADLEGYNIDINVARALGGLSSCGAEIQSFRKNIKDTFEDEVADVLLRIFDLCGYLGIEYFKTKEDCLFDYNTVPVMIFTINKEICEIPYNIRTGENKYYIFSVLIDMVLFFAEYHNIDIERYIKLKMQYNKTREYKHGKKY